MKKTVITLIILLAAVFLLSGCTGIKMQSYKRDVEKMGGLPVVVNGYDANSENGMVSEFIAGSEIAGAYLLIIEFRDDGFAKEYFESSEEILKFYKREGFKSELSGRFICVINGEAETLIKNYRDSKSIFK